MIFYKHDKEVTLLRELAPYDIKEIKLSESEIAQIVAIVFDLDTLSFADLEGMVKGNRISKEDYGPIDAEITPPTKGQKVNFWDEAGAKWIDGWHDDGFREKLASGVILAYDKARYYTAPKGPPKPLE